MVVGGKDREDGLVVSTFASRSEYIKKTYDEGDSVIRFFLDKVTLAYTCGLFNGDNDSIEAAQVRKADHTLNKLNLKRGQTLLDVGYGYGYLPDRASRRFKVRVLGLNLSLEQVAYAQANYGNNPQLDLRLQGWESFDEPVDAAVSIGSFEHFGRVNHADFFVKMRKVIKPEGLFLLHTIHFNGEQLMKLKENDWAEYKNFLRYTAFIKRKIFQGGELTTPGDILQQADEAGFGVVDVERLVNMEGGSQYIRTLNEWAKT